MSSPSGISGTLTLFTADALTGAAGLSGYFVPTGPGKTRWTLDRLRSEQGASDAGRALIDSLELAAREQDALAAQPLIMEWTLDAGTALLARAAPQALSSAALVRAVVERVQAGRLARATALLAVLPHQLESAGTFSLDAGPDTLLARGLAASAGAVVGPLAMRNADVCEGSIWVVTDLGAEDAPLLTITAGVVATSGGLTSDAAIMSRALRKPCVVSTPIRTGDHTSGEIVSLDGGTGELHRGALAVRWQPTHAHAETLLGWAIEQGGPEGRPGEILQRARSQGGAGQ